MRGSPLFRALLVFTLMLALAPVLWRLTQPEPQQLVAPAAPPAVPRAVQLALAFTAPPKHASVMYLGKTVWSKDAPAPEEKCELKLAWPDEGGELDVSVDWPDGAPLAAVRLRLRTPAGQTIERSLWGSGPTEDTVGFP